MSVAKAAGGSRTFWERVDLRRRRMGQCRTVVSLKEGLLFFPSCPFFPSFSSFPSFFFFWLTRLSFTLVSLLPRHQMNSYTEWTFIGQETHLLTLSSCFCYRDAVTFTTTSGNSICFHLQSKIPTCLLASFPIFLLSKDTQVRKLYSYKPDQEMCLWLSNIYALSLWL